MGTGAAREDPEAVAERAEVRREGVGNSALEPTQTTRRPAAEHRALRVCVTQRALDAVKPPDREHVRGVSAANDDDVLGPDEGVDVVDHAVEQCEMARFAIHTGERLIEGEEVARPIA